MANLLVVDDRPAMLALNVSILESVGHLVQTGGNGVEGLRSLASGPLPDCVVLDVDMPVLNGPGMVHQMLINDAGEEKIPIVLVSARDNLAAVAKSVGTPYFVTKAVSDYESALVAVLDRALRERRAPS